MNKVEELVNIIKDFIPSEAKCYVNEEYIARELVVLGYGKVEDYKKENERLKKENAILTHDYIIMANTLTEALSMTKETTSEESINKITKEVEEVQQAVKEFSEKLKTKFDEQKHFYEVAEISHRDISLIALNTVYKMLNDLLKEYNIDT